MKKFLVITIILSVISIVCLNMVDLRLSYKSNGYTIKGIDISHHNDIDDWSKIKEQTQFVFIKATEGQDFKDSKFKSNWRNAKKQNITRGAYHFFTPNVPAEEQFNNFKNSVNLKKGDLPPMLDVETKGFDPEEVNKWIKLAKDHYGVTPILYTEFIFFKFLLEDKVTDCDIFIYVDQKFHLKPSFNNYKCSFWQYSHTGKVNGINGDVDLDYFIGDSVEFNNLLIK